MVGFWAVAHEAKDKVVQKWTDMAFCCSSFKDGPPLPKGSSPDRWKVLVCGSPGEGSVGARERLRLRAAPCRWRSACRRGAALTAWVPC